MFEFILIVYLTKESPPQYIGNFETCAFANNYVQIKLENVYRTSCLHEDYVWLPEGHQKRVIHFRNGKIEP